MNKGLKKIKEKLKRPFKVFGMFLNAIELKAQMLNKEVFTTKQTQRKFGKDADFVKHQEKIGELKSCYFIGYGNDKRYSRKAIDECIAKAEERGRNDLEKRIERLK